MPGINRYVPTQAPIYGILAGLQAVHQFYGINTEKQQAKLLEAQANLTGQKAQEEATTFGQTQADLKELQTPGTPASDFAKNIGAAIVSGSMPPKKEDGSYQNPAMASALQKLSGMVSDPKVPGYTVTKYLTETSALKELIAEEKMTAQMQMQAALLGQHQDTIQNRSSGLYEKTMGPYEQPITSANEVLQMLPQLKESMNTPGSEGAQATKAVMANLSPKISALYLGARGAGTVSPKEENTATGFVTNLFNRIDSGDRSVETTGQLDQLMAQTKMVRDALASSHAAKFQSFIQSQPQNSRPFLSQSFQTFRQMQGLDAGGVQGGPSPVAPSPGTGGGMNQPGRSPQSIPQASPGPPTDDDHAKALQFVKDHPTDPRAKLILQVNPLAKQLVGPQPQGTGQNGL